jgi:hypothetical protein
MLLIKQSEYSQHQSALSAVTANHETIEINSNGWIYCEVTNQVQFDIYSVNLNANNFGDGILLPPTAVEK